MIAVLLAAHVAFARPASSEADVGDLSTPKKSWFSQIHYGVGIETQLGGGTDGTVFGDHLVVEPLAFELRSFLWPRVAFHTTLNLGRMIAPAIESHDGRIDYDCHLAGHVPVSNKLTIVVAPGAAIAYSFTKSRYQRIMGDVRVGIDLPHGHWTTGFYLRPYVGWYREVGEDHGRVAGGGTLDVVTMFLVPRRGERQRSE